MGPNREALTMKREVTHMGCHHSWLWSKLGTEGLPGQARACSALTMNNASLILGYAAGNMASKPQEAPVSFAWCQRGHTWVPPPEKTEMGQQKLLRWLELVAYEP